MSGAQKRHRQATKPEPKASRRNERSHNHHVSGGLLPRSRKKVYLPARLRWAATSIQTMFDATHLEEERHLVAAASTTTTTTTITDKTKITLSDTALHALVLCHERFLQVLASELSEACTNDDATEGDDQSQRATVRSYVQVRDVANSLDALGLAHLLKPAQADVASHKNSTTAAQPSRKGKQSLSRRSKKRKEWSASELEEQERLLARSKEKFEKNTAMKNIS